MLLGLVIGCHLCLCHFIHTFIAHKHHDSHQYHHSVSTHKKSQQWERWFGLEIFDSLQWGQVRLVDGFNEFTIKRMQPFHFETALYSLIDNQNREEIVIGDSFNYMNPIGQIGSN